MNSKKLLTIAHRGEAKQFLDYFSMSKLDWAHQDIYKSADETLYLVLTGEGEKPALMSTMAALALLHSEVSEIINLGIAGSLNQSECALEEIYEVRTCYAQGKNKSYEFKSYTSESLNTTIDNITTLDRVFDKKTSLEFYHIACLVDRELFGITQAAHFYKIPYRSFKLVSDVVGTIIDNDVTICDIIKEKAPVYSQKLLEYFLSKTVELEKQNNETIELEGFYFTIAQKRIYQSLMEKCLIKYPKLNSQEIFKMANGPQILLEKDMPKNKTAKLILELEYILNPFRKKIETEISELIRPYELENIKVSHDKTFETDDLHISFQVKNEQDLASKAKFIEQFPYIELKNIFKGDHV